MISVKALGLGFLLTLICAFEPSGDVWTPPEVYREIWKEAEKCTGRRGNFDRVIWHLSPGHDFQCPSGQCIGEWGPPHHITLADDWKYIRWVIKHEMIHDLTGYPHDHGPRDRKIWGEQCKATWGWLGDDPNYRP